MGLLCDKDNNKAYHIQYMHSIAYINTFYHYIYMYMIIHDLFHNFWPQLIVMVPETLMLCFAWHYEYYQASTLA